MMTIKSGAKVPFCLQSIFVISIFCLSWMMVDSYVPSHPKNQVPRRTSSSLSVSSSSRSLADQLKRSQKSRSATSSSEPSYIQWNHQKDLWKMQTAITTFQKGDQTVELHAQQHYGDADYFRYWNSDERLNNKHDCVLFELLVDDELLEYRRRNWVVTQPIMASTNDQQFGQNLGLQCQASIIDYTNRKWAHADLSRQEFTKLATNKEDSEAKTDTPLWKLASPDSSSTAAEAVAALMVGPPTINYSASSSRKRRLFTNLFVPGGNFASALRALLWMTVPAPELSIILLDWSSLLQGGSNPSALSEVALPILTSLVKFDISQMRRFLFGQVIMSSKNNGKDDPSSSWSLLVLDRNDHALKVLKRKLEDPTMKSVALLYGSSHCPDLHKKLVSMGFQATKTTWRTAWSVQEAENTSEDETQGLPALGLFLVFYLGIGALDWVGIVGDTSSLLLDSNYLDASIEVGAYLVRHVLLYLGLSKFLIDWTNTSR